MNAADWIMLVFLCLLACPAVLYLVALIVSGLTDL